MMKQKGFTLIEVILIIVVMAIAIPSLISAVSFMNQSQVNTIGTTTASNLAREELEAVIARKRSSCGACGYANIPVGLVPFAPVPGFPNYEVETDVQYVDSSLVPSLIDQGFKQITVTVQAVGVGPSVPDAVLVTLLTDY